MEEVLKYQTNGNDHVERVETSICKTILHILTEENKKKGKTNEEIERPFPGNFS